MEVQNGVNYLFSDNMQMNNVGLIGQTDYLGRTNIDNISQHTRDCIVNLFKNGATVDMLSIKFRLQLDQIYEVIRQHLRNQSKHTAHLENREKYFKENSDVEGINQFNIYRYYGPLIKSYLTNGEPKRKLFFEFFTHSDLFIVRTCIALENGLRLSDISRIFGLTYNTIFRYFSLGSVAIPDVVARYIVAEYKKHYSLLLLGKKFSLNYMQLFSLLIKYDSFDYDKTCNVINYSNLNKFSMTEKVSMLYKLGMPIDEICEVFEDNEVIIRLLTTLAG